MRTYNFQDYFTPEAVALIGKSEIVGIDGVTDHAVVLLSCDMVPYAVSREWEGLIHAGSLLGCLPCPTFALSDGLNSLDADGILDGLREFGVYGVIGEDIMFQPWGGRKENVSKALDFLNAYLPSVTLEEYDGLFLFKEESDMHKESL